MCNMLVANPYAPRSLWIRLSRADGRNDARFMPSDATFAYHVGKNVRRVARPRQNPKGAKVRLSVTVDPDLVKWVDKVSGAGRVFSSRSHLVERAIALLKRGYKDE